MTYTTMCRFAERPALMLAFAAILALSAGVVSAQSGSPAQAADQAKATDQAGKAEVKAPPAPPAPLPPITAKIYTKDNAPSAGKVDELPLKESVSQYGITWTFDKAARVGQFVNGDYYVVGEVTVKMIEPKPLFGDEVKEKINKSQVQEDKYPGKQARNGSSLNPLPRKPGSTEYCRVGFDSRTPEGRYDPELFAHLPIKMVPGDSLVSTISRENSQIKSFGGQHVDPLRVAAVLTCLAEPQPADAFRPSYCDSRNSKIFLARNLQRERLLKLPRVEGGPESLAKYTRQFQKPWIDLADFGFAAPVENLPHYGQQIAEKEGEASLLMLMDYPAEEKEALLINMVQVGIDLYGVARTGFLWRAHGGLYSGRKWPIILAGVMLDDPDMQTPTRKLPNLKFHEDDQTALGPETYRGKTFEKSWTGAKVIFMGHSPYLIKPTKAEEDGDHWPSGWGLLDVYPPSQWPDKNKDKGSILASEGYRRSNTSGCWIPTALAVRMMHLEKVWDHDAFFAYVDRWMTEDDLPQIKAIKEAGWFKDVSPELPLGEWPRQGYYSNSKWVGWVVPLWKKYRNNLPPAADGSKTPNAEETWK